MIVAALVFLLKCVAIVSVVALAGDVLRGVWEAGDLP